MIINVQLAATAAATPSGDDTAAFQEANDELETCGGGTIIAGHHLGRPATYRVGDLQLGTDIRLDLNRCTFERTPAATSVVAAKQTTITGDVSALGAWVGPPIPLGSTVTIEAGHPSRSDLITTTGPIGEGDATIPAAVPTSFPSTGAIWVGSELIGYIAHTPTGFVGATRGAHGTAPASYPTGATVQLATDLTAGWGGQAFDEAPPADLVSVSVSYGTTNTQVGNGTIDGRSDLSPGLPNTYGLFVRRSTGFTASRLFVVDADHGGVYANHSRGVVIDDCRFRGIGDPPLGAAVWFFGGVSHSRVSNCYVKSAGSVGVGIDDRSTKSEPSFDGPARHNSVSGSTFVGCSAGVSVGGESEYNRVGGNTVIAASGWGFAVGSADQGPNKTYPSDNMFIGNVVRGAPVGVRSVMGRRTVVSSNVFADVVTHLEGNASDVVIQ